MDTSEQKPEFRIGYLISYFVMAYVISWSFSLPAVLISNKIIELPEILSKLVLLATLGPFIAGFFMTYRETGWAGVKTFWKRGWNFKFPKIWILIAFIMPLGLNLLVVFLINLTGGEFTKEDLLLSPISISFLFVFLFFQNSIPEEYGWRGYALDHLQRKWNGLVSSLMLGFLHSLWHLPLHFIEGASHQNVPVWMYVIMVTFGGVLYAWLRNNANDSIFIAILFHTTYNACAVSIPYWNTTHGLWIYIGVQLVLVLLIVLYSGPATLVRGRKS